MSDGRPQGIEALTTTWDKTVIDRTEDLRNWAGLFRQFVSRNLKVYAYANNHCAGHGPGTVKLFRDTFSGEPEGHMGLGEILPSAAYMARLEVAVA
jgi:hypothetical protein